MKINYTTSKKYVTNATVTLYLVRSTIYGSIVSKNKCNNIFYFFRINFDIITGNTYNGVQGRAPCGVQGRISWSVQLAAFEFKEQTSWWGLGLRLIKHQIPTKRNTVCSYKLSISGAKNVDKKPLCSKCFKSGKTATKLKNDRH